VSHAPDLPVRGRPHSLTAGAVTGLAALLLTSLPAAPAAASGVVPDEILAEDARAPVPTYLYDFTEDEGEPGAGFDALYERDPFSGDRILPGELCAFGPRDDVDAECLDLEPEGFRYRGSSTRLLPKKSFNIRWDDRIQGPEAFTAYRDEGRGQSRLNANAMWTDPSMMRERLAMGMFETIDRPGPQTRHVTLHHNDVFEGLYTHVQRIDQNLAADLGLVTGGGSQRNNIHLVRDQYRDSDDFADSMFGVDASEYTDEELVGHYEELWNWRRLPGDDDDDWTEVIELHRWASEWTFERASGGFAEEFSDRFDVGNFTDWLAIHYLIGDIDSFGDDYWLFYNQFDDEPRWQVIPWDKDLTFGSHFRDDRFGAENDFFAYEYGLETLYDNRLIGLFLDDPQLRAGLDARLRELMDEVFTLDYFEQRTATIADAIEEQVDVDPATPGAFERHPANHHGELGRFDDHVESLLDFVQLRYAFLDRVLDPVDGERDSATVGVADVPSGERITFTDAHGFTIGTLDLATRTPATRQLSLTVDRTHGGDVDRRYTLSTDRGRVTGDLTLFYRNEVESFLGAPEENWYREDVATGGQWDLAIAEERGRTTRPLASRANALSNKVTDATVSATPAGTNLRLVER
jgi:spore coat protein H